MKHVFQVMLVGALIAGISGVAGAQNLTGRGRVMTPASSIERVGDAGVRAHTHLRIFEPETGRPFAGPPFTGYGYETPASIACIYGWSRKNLVAIPTPSKRIPLAATGRLPSSTPTITQPHSRISRRSRRSSD